MKGPMNARWFVVPVLASISLLGCQGTSKSTPTAPSGPAPAAEAPKPAAGAPSPTATVPASLMHEGYAYFGLGNLKPMTYTAVVASTADTKPAPLKGTIVATLASATSTEAIFKVARTNLGTMDGTDDIRVDAEGVWTVSSTKGKFDKPTMELPAKMDLGKSWPVKASFTADTGQSFSLEGTMKIERDEKIKVAAGEFMCRVVTLDTKLTTGGVTGRTTGTSWYAKDVGLIKQVMEQSAGGSKATITLTLESMTK